jgi:MSHA biogenesis protein MshM
MYCQHFGLREMPFRMPPQSEYFYTGAARGEMLQTIRYAILHREGVIKVSGEVGTGKTMLCRMLIESLPEHVIPLYLASPTLARVEMLCALARDLGLVLESTAPHDVTLALQHRLIDLHVAGKKVVLIVDEAHAMPLDALEEIRLLSNLETKHDRLLQVVLFGQDELDDILEQDNMRALRERIALNFSLNPFQADDVASYLQFRLTAAGHHGGNIFQPAAVRLIAKYSGA